MSSAYQKQEEQYVSLNEATLPGYIIIFSEAQAEVEE